MAAPAVLMDSVVRAAVRNVGNFLTFGLAGDVLADAWDSWRKQQREEAARRKEVEALAALAAEEAREAARRALAEVPGLEPESRQRLEDCLANIPATIRRSLRSVADPTGRTLPAARRLDSAEALGSLLPLMPTRFKAGDR